MAAAKLKQNTTTDDDGKVVQLSHVPRFLDRLKKSKAEIDELKEVQADIFEEADEAGLHLRALKKVAAYARMEPVKFEVEFTALVEYLKQGGLLHTHYPCPTDHFVQSSLFSKASVA